MFERYGDVKSCRILRHLGSKKSRGFGFIRMTTSKQAEAAREGLRGIEVEGRTLAIVDREGSSATKNARLSPLCR